MGSRRAKLTNLRAGSRFRSRMKAVPGVENAFRHRSIITVCSAIASLPCAGHQQVLKPIISMGSFELIANGVIQGDLRVLGWKGTAPIKPLPFGSLCVGVASSRRTKLLVYSRRTRQTISGAFLFREDLYDWRDILIVGLFMTMTYIYMDLEEATLLFEGGKL